jgi:uncharacterized protein
MGNDARADLGRRLIDAYNTRDLETLGNLFEEGAVWHSSRGDQVGRAAILELLVSVSDRSGGTFRQELHDVLATDTHLVLLSRAVGRRGSKAIDDPEVTVFHLRDGRVHEAWAHPFDQQARSTFWA